MRIAPWAAGLLGLGILAVLLEQLVAGGVISPLVLPAPSEIGASIGDLFREEGLGAALLTTLFVTGAAIGLAIVIGIPAGYLLYRHPAFGAAYEPWLAALFAAPMVLLYPLFLVIFGRGHLTIVLMGAITGIIPIILNVHQGLASVSRTLGDVGRTFNCSASQQFRLILLPAATPTIFTGIRLGVIYALVNIIGIEFLIAFGGLGRLVGDLYDRFDIPGMYGAILFIILLSTAFFWVLGRVQTWLRPV